MSPRKRPRFREDQVSGHVRTLLGPAAVRWYRTEVGGTGRRTRGTAGYPDLTGIMKDPVPYVLMVETKGRDTGIEEAQWRFAAEAALIGQPCLIVRSPGALLNGLKYLGLLPRKLARAPDIFWEQWDAAEWPENVWYMERMAHRFWLHRGFPEWSPAVALPDSHPTTRKPPWPLGPEWNDKVT